MTQNRLKLSHKNVGRTNESTRNREKVLVLKAVSSEKNIFARNVVSGGAWLGGVKVLQQLLSFVVNAVLARLLFPEAFGLVAIVTVVNGFIVLMTSIGFGAAIIQSKTATQVQLSTLFWINLCSSLFTGLVIYFGAPYAAEFYEEPEIINLIRVMSVSFLVMPLSMINRKMLERDLSFKKLARIDLIVSIVASVAAVFSALLGAGVYSLIIQSLSTSIISSALIVSSFKWLPDMVFLWTEVKEMVFYSLKYKGAMTTNYFERNVDYIIIGKMFSAEVLGAYVFAYNIMYFPVKRISYVFTEILFPAFSMIQNDFERLQAGYIRSIKIIAIATFPMMAFIAVFAEPVVLNVFGAKWIAAVPIVRILSFAGALQSIDQIGGSLFLAINRPEVNFYLGIFRAVSTTVLVLGGLGFGIEGVAIGIVISKIVFFVTGMILLNKLIRLRVILQMRALVGPLLAACVTIIVAILAVRLIGDVRIALILSMMLAVASALTSTLITNFHDIQYFILNLRAKLEN